MTKGNKGFGASIAAGIAAAPPGEAPSAARDVLGSRSDALSQLASGKLVIDRTEWVDTARCRPWSLHNRDLDHLNEASCADLISSLKAEGRQRIPAIVRRLRDDPDHDYEIIAGVRRWWSIGWLRSHNYPQFDYLVTIQTITDEEGFRLADVENRARRDISDLERARDYLRALELFYDGSQTAMAARLNVSNSWMSRILEVGRLPQEIIDAFADSHDVTARHAGQLAPSLRRTEIRERMIERAGEIRDEHVAGGVPLDAHQVVAALLASASGAPRRKASAPRQVMAANGRPMLKVEAKGRGKALTIHVLPRSNAQRAELQAAVLEALEGYF
jgi:ParB family chromosome partitioning protein